MKTMRSMDGKRIFRTTDEKAAEMYHNGDANYAPKEEWKKEVRDVDKPKEEGTEKVSIADIGYRDNIWRINNGAGFGQSNKEVYAHPATMPEELARGHIITWSNPGDLVLDPFMGSGTTARMAYREDRNWIGFEIDPTYYELCQKLTTFNSVFDK